MKKSIIAFLLIFIINFALLQFLPWWIISVVAFCICYFFIEKKRSALILSFLSGGLLWGLAAFILDQSYSVPVAQVLASIIDSQNSASIYLMPTILAGIVSGLGGLLGSLLRSISRNPDSASL